MSKNMWLIRGIFTITLAGLLLPFPSLAFSLGGAPSPVFKSETLDIGPHVAVCGLNGNMQLGENYYIELCAWNGDHSGGPIIQGASVWYEIRTATGPTILSSGNMTTDDHGRAKFTQTMDFGEGRFRVSAWMSYGGTYYSQLQWEDWSYFNVYGVIVEPNNPPCPWKTPQGTVYCW